MLAIRLTILLLIAIMTMGVLAVYAAASELPGMMNVEIVGDYLYWDAVDGAEAYSFGVKNSGGYVDALKDENGNILKRQSFNLKEYCEENDIPGGTLDVHVCAVSTYIWKGGKYLTDMWYGKYTYVASKPQLAKPTNVRLDAFDLSWDPVPGAERYRVVFARLTGEIPYGSDPTYPEDQRYVFEITENHIDLKECFVPDNTHYILWLTAQAEGFFTSDEYIKTFEKDPEWLTNNLPERFIKNVRISTDGMLSWDPYSDAAVYSIGVGKSNSAFATVGDGITRDPATGRLSCDINYYCATFGFDPAELDIKLSAFSDAVGKGGCRISGISKLKYNYAGVKQLTGEVSYGGEARYGSTISAYISGGISGVPLNYEWQVHLNGVWTKIASASNSRELKINSADLVDKYIRVSVTAASGAYIGTINGAPKQVGKSQPYLPFETPSLSYTLTKSGGKDVARVKITNYKSDLEYVMTNSPAAGSWPASGSKLSSDSFDIDLSGSAVTYYVYARYAETATREGGTNYIGASVLIPPKSGNNKSATDLIYPEFDTKAPTIYLKVGEKLTVKYQISPADANANLPRWNTAYDGIVGVAHNASAKTLTITATKVGNAFVTAYKPSESTPWYYGSDYSNMGRTIKVVVYDPNDLGALPITPVRLGDMEMYIGDVHTLDFNELSRISFVPDGVDKSKFKYSAYVKTKDNLVGAPFVGEISADGSVSIKNSVLTAKRAGEATVYLFALTDNSVPTNANRYFAYFTVKVSEKPEITVERLILNNTSVTLRVGESIKLTATKDPIGAIGTVQWFCDSGNSIVKVESDGRITAVGKGSAVVFAVCGDKNAYCTVEVLPTYCSEHKEVSYSYLDQNNHMWTCAVCGACGTEPHSNYVWSSDGTYHWRACDTIGCGAIIEATKSKHTSSGSNAATCLAKATCDICKKHYGSTAAHTASSVLLNDKTGHWNTCTTAGCFQKLNFEAHTPDHSGSATEAYAIKCKICGYVIEAQKGHTHAFDKSVASDENLASPATCTSKARYYKTCECGQRGTETFESGALAAHTEGTEWMKDADGHWHACTTPGCGAAIEASRAKHELVLITDKAATATESGMQHEECSICGYKQASVEIPALGGETASPETTGADTTAAETSPDTTAPSQAEIPEPSEPENIAVRTLIIAVAAVLLLAGIVVVVFLIIKNNKKK